MISDGSVKETGGKEKGGWAASRLPGTWPGTLGWLRDSIMISPIRTKSHVPCSETTGVCVLSAASGCKPNCPPARELDGIILVTCELSVITQQRWTWPHDVDYPKGGPMVGYMKMKRLEESNQGLARAKTWRFVWSGVKSCIQGRKDRYVLCFLVRESKAVEAGSEKRALGLGTQRRAGSQDPFFLRFFVVTML